MVFVLTSFVVSRMQDDSFFSESGLMFIADTKKSESEMVSYQNGD